MRHEHTKAETLLSINDVSLHFGSKVVLSHVNAEVKNIERPDLTQGQVVCFLGPSGIGKTQLSRLIAGLNAPTSGTIALNGDVPTRAGLVGLVQQNYPLFPYLTARENLVVAHKMGGEKSKTAKMDLIGFYAETLGLKTVTLDLYPHRLSGGQRQRVAIIRQLLCSEHFLIMDEPFSGLDIKAKAAACKLIQDVAAMHTLNTIIVITHDVTEGMSVADTVWLMGVEQGIPGAHIIHEWDLADMGFAWREDIQHDAAFQHLVRDVKDAFLQVSP